MAGQAGPRPALCEKVALVTGASRGIGRAIAVRLAREGAYVFVNFRSASGEAAACVRAIQSAGGGAEAIGADITRESQVARMFKAIAKRAGRLDIFIGNAGIAPISRDPRRVTTKIWNDTFAVNVTGAFLCVRSAMPLLKRSKSGRIILIGSAAARLGGTIGPHYAASKAALTGLVEYFSRALGHARITVNLLEPGFVATGLSRGLHATPAKVRAMRRSVPLGRIGTVEDVAGAVAFLASEEAAYITRQHIAVSGGR